MKILVITQKHGLTPFAWRLRREDNDVELMVVKARYEQAWEGRFGKVLRANDKRLGNLEPAIEAAKAGEVVMLTDSAKWTGLLGSRGVTGLYGVLPAREEPSPHFRSPLRLGAWFDGEALRGRHLLIVDRGLWPSGAGADVEAAATLVRPLTWPDAFEEALQGVVDELKAASHRGLVQVAPQGGLVAAGWSWLHSHAFVGDQPSLTGVLNGQEPQFPKRFTVVVSVTTSPWPVPSSTPPEPVPVGIPVDQTASIFFHDMQVAEGDRVRTAGLDGCVAVVRGSAEQLALARGRALTVAGRMELPERQVRGDAGAETERVLCWLEDAGLVI